MNRAWTPSPAAALRATASGSPARVGLLAGWGRFPLLVAEGLRELGIEVYCLGVRGHADPCLADVCNDFAWTGLLEFGRAIRYFRRHGCQRATMAGKIFKQQLFTPGALVWNHRPDWRTLGLVWSFLGRWRRDRQDDTLLLSVIEEFAKDRIAFLPATDLVPELLVPYGQLSRRGPTRAERLDIEFGWRMAKEMGRLDVGQSVAVRNQATVAIEAMEGTDRCIERAGQLCGGAAFTLVKVAKPQQDMRFDVPTVGLGTLETLRAAGGRCLAIEAERTILVDREAFLRYADAQGLCVVALRDAECPGDEPQPAEVAAATADPCAPGR